MEITRRKFFFFGLAAGVGLLLLDQKIELTKKELFIFNPHRLQAEFLGIPYHENNASVGTWLGIPRGESIHKEIIDMIKILEKDKLYS